MKEARLILASLAAGAICVSCVDEAKPTVHPVVQMAMFDLNCPREQLLYTRIDDATWGVEGCGQRAKYVKICRQVGYGMAISDDCRWVRN
ncbi:MAG TPA: hypothetical protein VK841_20785 [Polyangiaceae bacterium]|jgi:hypothetical protein|nr:hypothetical protein [Polyangiaceae bacterium]